MSPTLRGLNSLQKISMSLMGVLVLITFIGANLHAVLWQSSSWLVSTVLPAVVVSLTNDERSNNSAPPLVRNSTLDDAAKLKAQHMAKNEYFSHFSPKGVSPWHWFDEAGYVYAHAGENLAIHFTDSSEVVDAWMDSPTHKQNIVNGLYTEIGVGTAKGKYEGYDTVYVVQLFGTPAVVPASSPAPEPEQFALATEPALPVVTETIEIPNVEVVLDVEPIEVMEESVIEIPSEVTPAEAEVKIPETVLVATYEPELETIAEESPVLEEEVVVSEAEVVESDVVVIESPVIATSSGLAVAQIDTTQTPDSGSVFASVATQPNVLLQVLYTILAVVVVMLLGTSIVLEAKKLRFQQVAYGLLLLFGMGGLWFVNSLLTTGAVIV